MKKSVLFISSVQKELQEERRAIHDFIQGDPLCSRYFRVFLFEDLPATDRRADNVYLEEVDRCEIYVGLFGNEYGREDAKGLSPTEREFERATTKSKRRLIFVKGTDDKKRHPKMLKLIRKAGSQLIRRRFTGLSDLTAALYASLVDHLERTGLLRTLPFDADVCTRASLHDIDQGKLEWFLQEAHRERNFALPEKTPVTKALTHLNLVEKERPNHAAVLLFGRNPQRFVPSAEVKCLHFHGTEVRKPIPSYQLFKGNVFEQVDQAVDFVMSKIVRSVGTRAEGPEAPVEYEFPKEVVSEAVVNAVAHRDYTSNAGIQVMLFADRLEVWNPGELPPPLTPERLREPHPSIPHNPLIAECLYLTHYIEKAGTGTLDMIDRCREASLSEPEFEQRGNSFVITLWRDWLTAEVMDRLNLNERQRKAILHVRIHQRITNTEYQQMNGVAKATASRDLDALTVQGVFQKRGTTGKGTHYVLCRKGLTKGSNGS
jgi:predicted HTH transcriptional regulator